MKNKKVIYYLIGCFLAGIIFTSFAYSTRLAVLSEGLHMLKWWVYPLIIIVAFYVTLIIHEMTHFLSFYFNGTKLRAVYLTIFIFYKTKNGWKFSIEPKLWVLVGGFVVPDLDEIKNDKDYEHTIESFKKSLMAAPLATIFYLAFTIISMIIVLLYMPTPLFNALYFIYTIIVFILSMLYIKSFSISTSQIFGDFVAHKKIQKNKWFQLAQFIQYQSFSLEHGNYNSYLFQKSVELLSKTNYLSQLFQYMVLNYYLEGVNYYQQTHDPLLDKLFSQLKFSSFKKDEIGLICAYEFAIFLYDQKEVDRSYQLYLKINEKNYKKIDDKLLKYLKVRYEHITHLNDYDAFLADLDNIYTDHTWIFHKIIDPYKDIHLKHQKRSKQAFVCLVDLKEKK